jgi:hypothetical protein
MALALGFEKILHDLRGNGLGAGLAGKSGNHSAAGRNVAGGLESLADKAGQDAAETLFPFLRQMLGDLQNIFVQIDCRPHVFDSN